MYHHLATRFGRNSHQISGREALDNEALFRHVPSVFAREAHDSRSERYVYVPTIEIVEGLRREGVKHSLVRPSESFGKPNFTANLHLYVARCGHQVQ